MLGAFIGVYFTADVDWSFSSGATNNMVGVTYALVSLLGSSIALVIIRYLNRSVSYHFIVYP